MRSLKNVATVIILLCIGLYCSGCATILGGIIGYQSGEMLAGAAIGAALDFGPGIADGIGQMLADPEKDFKNQASIDSAAGKIQLPKAAFTQQRLEWLSGKIRRTFEENSWSYSLEEKKIAVGSTLFSEKWSCKTSDNTPFKMTILRQKCKKPEILITVDEASGDGQRTGEITIRIHDWIGQSLKRKQPGC